MELVECFEEVDLALGINEKANGLGQGGCVRLGAAVVRAAHIYARFPVGEDGEVSHPVGAEIGNKLVGDLVDGHRE